VTLLPVSRPLEASVSTATGIHHFAFFEGFRTHRQRCTVNSLWPPTVTWRAVLHMDNVQCSGFLVSIVDHRLTRSSRETLHTSIQTRSSLISPQNFPGTGVDMYVVPNTYNIRFPTCTTCCAYVEDVGQYNAIFLKKISERITNVLDLQFVVSQVTLDLTPRYL